MNAATKEWVCISGMLLVIAFFYFQMPEGGEEGSTLFPGMMMCLMLGLTAIKAATELRYPKKDSGKAKEPFPLLRVLVVIAGIILYIAAIEPVGFYLSSFLFFFLITVAIQTTPRTAKGMAVRACTVFACLLFLYALFTVLLQTQIPRGIFI